MNKDILVEIYFFLCGKDVISCSKVNKLFYTSSINNVLWFSILTKEISKLNIPSVPYFFLVYDETVLYKNIYVQLSNLRYNSMIGKLYTKFFRVIETESNTLEKIIVPLVLVPSAFPFVTLFDLFTFLEHKRHKDTFCKCKSCKSKWDNITFNLSECK